MHVSHALQSHQPVHDEIIEIVHSGHHDVQQEIVLARHGPARGNLVHALDFGDEALG